MAQKKHKLEANVAGLPVLKPAVKKPEPLPKPGAPARQAGPQPIIQPAALPREVLLRLIGYLEQD